MNVYISSNFCILQYFTITIAALYISFIPLYFFVRETFNRTSSYSCFCMYWFANAPHKLISIEWVAQSRAKELKIALLYFEK